MRLVKHLTLASLALAAPLSAMAGDVPASRSAAASTTVQAPKHKHGLFGNKQCAACAAKAAAAAEAAAPASADVAEARHCPHMTNGVCLECSSKLSIVAPNGPTAPHVHTNMGRVAQAAVPDTFAGGQIVSCSHQQNGICRECKTLLEMPGQVTVITQNGAPTAPGRAVASDAAPAPGLVQAGEPEPIGVMRTNYSVPTAGSPAPMAPGRAVVNGGPAAGPAAPAVANFTPYQHASAEGSPHIIGHLFGLAPMRNDFRDWMMSRTRNKKDAHAAIPYGSTGSQVEELPASMVYGKTPH